MDTKELTALTQQIAYPEHVHS